MRHLDYMNSKLAAHIGKLVTVLYNIVIKILFKKKYVCVHMCVFEVSVSIYTKIS